MGAKLKRKHSAYLALVVAMGPYYETMAANPPDLEPVMELSVEPSLSVADKEANNVSGAACHFENDTPLSCLLIGDEVRYARAFSFNHQTVNPGHKVFLLPKKDEFGNKYDETDAEGIAYADGFTTSPARMV